jgi:hypothetical protein
MLRRPGHQVEPSKEWGPLQYLIVRRRTQNQQTLVFTNSVIFLFSAFDRYHPITVNRIVLFDSKPRF